MLVMINGACYNPFATVVLAHLTAQDTRRDPQSRRNAKFALTRRLYEKGYRREDVLELFRFIDWLLQLPAALEDSFWHEVQQYEEEQRMTYITTVERRGIEKGLEQGREEGLEQGREEGFREGFREGLLTSISLVLELKFGPPGVALLPEIEALHDVTILQAILASLKTATTLDEVRRVYAAPPGA